MVDAIWREMGLGYPPKVERLPTQATARQADATRLTLRLPEQVPPWILLHELAHAMTSTHDGVSDGHGPLFVGLYVDLLVRYLRLDRTVLRKSLETAGITINPIVRPIPLNDEAEPLSHR